jgi:outer membrane receptor protein involved in Fe transport
VQNIFDKEPPLVSTGSGATRIGNAVAISNYDVLGRRAFATVEYRF